MKLTKRKKVILILIIFSSIISTTVFEFKRELYYVFKFYTENEGEFQLNEKEINDFSLLNGQKYELINSGIKQNYNIYFEGNIVNFGTFFIGKGSEKYNSSYIEINKDSIVFNKIKTTKNTKSYEHNLSLKNNLSINIGREVNSTIVTIINEKDTLNINSDFVGMDKPFIKSVNSNINVDTFKFTSNDYYSDVFIFGDSYVNSGNPHRWPYYIYNKQYTFLLDGLPGGKSIDSYDYLKSALSIHKPKYLIWCLGMNDGGDRLGISLTWKHYLNKVEQLCKSNNINLILSTVPSIPTRDNTLKNEYVRKSGYRYIDFDKVVSDSKGNWKNGMLSDDGVHPTEMGAKVMSERFLVDFPEIKNYLKITNTITVHK